RRCVDQRTDGAAVHNLADRRQLRLEGELEDRLVGAEGGNANPELRRVRRIWDERLDDLAASRRLVHIHTVCESEAEQRRAQREDRAGVDAVLLLEFVLEAI